MQCNHGPQQAKQRVKLGLQRPNHASGGMLAGMTGTDCPSFPAVFLSFYNWLAYPCYRLHRIFSVEACASEALDYPILDT